MDNEYSEFLKKREERRIYNAEYYIKKRQQLKELLVKDPLKLCIAEKNELDKLYNKFVIQKSNKYVPKKDRKDRHIRTIEFKRERIEVSFN
tara:strand:+ start:1026 stop:1298 length:273 start_codon:yes stop_codon:yes gene_type:complete